MKKLFFISLSAIAAISMVSCQKQDIDSMSQNDDYVVVIDGLDDEGADTKAAISSVQLDLVGVAAPKSKTLRSRLYKANMSEEVTSGVTWTWSNTCEGMSKDSQDDRHAITATSVSTGEITASATVSGKTAASTTIPASVTNEKGTLKSLRLDTYKLNYSTLAEEGASTEVVLGGKMGVKIIGVHTITKPGGGTQDAEIDITADVYAAQPSLNFNLDPIAAFNVSYSGGKYVINPVHPSSYAVVIGSKSLSMNYGGQSGTKSITVKSDLAQNNIPLYLKCYNYNGSGDPVGDPTWETTLGASDNGKTTSVHVNRNDGSYVQAYCYTSHNAVNIYVYTNGEVTSDSSKWTNLGALNNSIVNSLFKFNNTTFTAICEESDPDEDYSIYYLGEKITWGTFTYEGY